MNFTEVFTFRRHKDSSSKGQSSVDSLAESSNENRNLKISEFLPDIDDYTSYGNELPEAGVPDDEVVFKNPDGKVVTKVSYNSGWEKKGIIGNSKKSGIDVKKGSGRKKQRFQQNGLTSTGLRLPDFRPTIPPIKIQVNSANQRPSNPRPNNPRLSNPRASLSRSSNLRPNNPLSSSLPSWTGDGQRRAFLAGGGYGQAPYPDVNIKVPPIRVAGVNFGGSNGAHFRPVGNQHLRGYGAGGYGHAGVGYGYGQVPPGLQIQGPQNINLGLGQNVNLGLNIPFFDIRICPDIVLGLIVVAAAAAALGLYIAITQAGRRRRKRRSSAFDLSPAQGLGQLLDVMVIGMYYILCRSRFLMKLHEVMFDSGLPYFGLPKKANQLNRLVLW